MTDSRSATIRVRLTLLVLACVLPAFLMAVAWTVYEHNRSRSQLIAEAFTLVRAMIASVDRDLAGTQAALAALATSPAFGESNWPQVFQQAEAVQRNQGVVNLLAFDRSYQQRLNTLRPLGSKLPVDRNPVVQRVFATDRPGVSDIFIGPVLGKPLIGVVVPVRVSGATRYALAASFSPERLAELLQQQRLPAGWYGVIFDSRARIVAGLRGLENQVGEPAVPELAKRIAQKAEDTLEITARDGTPVRAVFSKSEVTGWTVALGIPIDAIEEQLPRRLAWILAGTALLLLGSLALAWRIGGRIATSIQQLVDPALAVGAGKLVSVPRLDLKEADEVGMALTRASQMLASAHHKANHDGLTGLANRALLEEVLRHELAVADRAGRQTCVLYVDLDGFKPVNDRHGHAAGDEILRLVAMRLKSVIRESDLAARLGGDEFAVVLPDTGLEGSKVAANRILERISSPYSVAGHTIGLSASVGIAPAPRGVDTDAVLVLADEALYLAKAAGKGQYAVHPQALLSS